jgi:hypothetical protein
MMKVRFDYPMGAEGWQKDCLMSNVPRVGEFVEFDEDHEYTVHVVVWHLGSDTDFDAYVVVR